MADARAWDGYRPPGPRRRSSDRSPIHRTYGNSPERDLFPDRARHMRDSYQSASQDHRDPRDTSSSYNGSVNHWRGNRDPRDRRDSKYFPEGPAYDNGYGARQRPSPPRPYHARQGSFSSGNSLRRSHSPPYYAQNRAPPPRLDNSPTHYNEWHRGPDSRNRNRTPDFARRSDGPRSPRRDFYVENRPDERRPRSPDDRERSERDRDREARDYKSFVANRSMQGNASGRAASYGDHVRERSMYTQAQRRSSDPREANNLRRVSAPVTAKTAYIETDARRSNLKSESFKSADQATASSQSNDAASTTQITAPGRVEEITQLPAVNDQSQSLTAVDFVGEKSGIMNEVTKDDAAALSSNEDQPAKAAYVNQADDYVNPFDTAEDNDSCDDNDDARAVLEQPAERVINDDQEMPDDTSITKPAVDPKRHETPEDKKAPDDSDSKSRSENVKPLIPNAEDNISSSNLEQDNAADNDTVSNTTAQGPIPSQDISSPSAADTTKDPGNPSGDTSEERPMPENDSIGNSPQIVAKEFLERSFGAAEAVPEASITSAERTIDDPAGIEPDAGPADPSHLDMVVAPPARSRSASIASQASTVHLADPEADFPDIESTHQAHSQGTFLRTPRTASAVEIEDSHEDAKSGQIPDPADQIRSDDLAVGSNVDDSRSSKEVLDPPTPAQNAAEPSNASSVDDLQGLNAPSAATPQTSTDNHMATESAMATASGEQALTSVSATRNHKDLAEGKPALPPGHTKAYYKNESISRAEERPLEVALSTESPLPVAESDVMHDQAFSVSERPLRAQHASVDAGLTRSSSTGSNADHDVSMADVSDAESGEVVEEKEARDVSQEIAVAEALAPNGLEPSIMLNHYQAANHDNSDHLKVINVLEETERASKDSEITLAQVLSEQPVQSTDILPMNDDQPQDLHPQTAVSVALLSDEVEIEEDLGRESSAAPVTSEANSDSIQRPAIFTRSDELTEDIRQSPLYPDVKDLIKSKYGSDNEASTRETIETMTKQVEQENMERAIEHRNKNRRQLLLDPQDHKYYANNVEIFKRNRNKIVALLCAKKTDLLHEEDELRDEYEKRKKRWQQHSARCDRQRLLDMQQEEAEAAAIVSSLAPTRGSRNKPNGFDIKEALIGVELPNNALNEARIPPFITDNYVRELYLYQDINDLIDDPLQYYHISVADPREIWTEEEQAIFSARYKATPKQFGVIAVGLPGRTAQDCVLHYYKSKKMLDYRASGRPKITKAGSRARGRAKKVVVGRTTRRQLLATISSLEADEDEVEEEVETKGLRKRRAITDIDDGARKSRVTRKTTKRNNGDEGTEDEQASQMPTTHISQKNGSMPIAPVPSSRTHPMGTINVPQHYSSTPPLPAPILQSRSPVLTQGQSQPHVVNDYNGATQYNGYSQPLIWTDRDEAQFIDLLKRYGTDYHILASNMPGRSAVEIQKHFDEHLIERGYRQYLPRPSGPPGRTLLSNDYAQPLNQNIAASQDQYHLSRGPLLNPPPQYPAQYSSYSQTMLRPQPAYGSFSRSGPPQPPHHSQMNVYSSNPPLHSAAQTYANQNYGHDYRTPPPSRGSYDARYNGPPRSGDRPPGPPQAPARASINSMLNSGERVQLPPIGDDNRPGPSQNRYNSYYGHQQPNYQSNEYGSQHQDSRGSYPPIQSKNNAPYGMHENNNNNNGNNGQYPRQQQWR